jgi:MFS family permease
VNAVLFFAMLIFETSGTDIDPNLCSIILGVVIMLAVFINLALIDRLGRRVLLIISETGMALSLCSLGVFFYLKKENDGVTPEGLSLLPLLSLVSFVVIYNVGAGPIPFLMMGEILPPEIKSLYFF